MNILLTKSKENPNVTKEEFIEDVHTLFQELKSSYGGYEYFTEEQFMEAKEKILAQIENSYEYASSKQMIKNILQEVIQDGHFSFGYDEGSTKKKYDYACHKGTMFGMDYFDLKKFYYDTNEEQNQLDDFVFQAIGLRKKDSFIIDLRDNAGGMDQYIYDFIELLFGVSPDYPLKCIQKYSETFKEYLKKEQMDTQFECENNVEEFESQGDRIPSTKKIYVLFNENTASSGESALACFKTIENVTLVGNHSKGCFFCGNCLTIYLPHSKIPVYFGTGMVLYEGNRNIDAEGGFKGDMSYSEFESMMLSKKS